MGLKVKCKSTGGDYQNPPTGTHLGVCVAVIEIGEQERQFGDAPANWVPEVVIAWELVDEQIPGKASNFIVMARYRASLNEKANLAKMLKDWRGRAIEEGEEIDLSALVGKSCMVILSESPSKKDPSKSYVNVTGVTQLPKGMKPKPATVKGFAWSIDEGKGFPDPEWLPYLLGEPVLEHIKRSREYQEKLAGQSGDAYEGNDGTDEEAPF